MYLSYSVIFISFPFKKNCVYPPKRFNSAAVRLDESATIILTNCFMLAAAQRYLGHTDPATTMRIYTHLADEMEMKDAEKVRKAFS